MVLEPDLLILDEPFRRLEAKARDDFRDEIRRVVANSSTTTLILTSDPREALAMADQLVVLDMGRVVQTGRPSDVYNRPFDAFVAQFLGPVNLIQGQVESIDPRGELVVRTPLGRLIGRSDAGSLATGSPVTIAIRPEALALGAQTAFDANRFAATVERLVFLGELRQVHLRGSNDHPVMALALQSHSRNLREGQGLSVHVSPEHVVIFPPRYTLRPEIAPNSLPAPIPPAESSSVPLPQ
jgi:ABC-type Fe3+/spermidine/putrescine transport system ATPase subunit